jgi:UDP-N-acetylglucosamine diphosphorylase / glucose-1-phosphate thymidylyltransferase / UDP-N-acetylgalactosamine diphosphorylase / glucosamine-1-phosphate N-acetyltransferase / galactosamine-1-phosphate N-acetyltransferase
MIQGPAVIGEDCLVGNYALIRGPVSMGDGARIGFAAEIKNAIIEERVLIGPQCFVADSKLERRAYLGAQVRTSNHRLDGQTVKVVVDGAQHDTGLEKLGCHIGAGASLGIQVIILPGRIVASGSTFGPRTTVEKNLPRGRYRLAQQLELY